MSDNASLTNTATAAAPEKSLGKVVVGMSGGVDSSTVTAMLQDQGYDVIGMTLWLMKGKGSCCTDALVDAAQLCEELGIPHHVVDTRDIFEENISAIVPEGNTGFQYEVSWFFRDSEKNFTSNRKTEKTTFVDLFSPSSK